MNVIMIKEQPNGIFVVSKKKKGTHNPDSIALKSNNPIVRKNMLYG